MRDLVAIVFVASALLAGCGVATKTSEEEAAQERQRSAENRKLDQGIDLSDGAAKIKAEADNAKTEEAEEAAAE